MNRGKIIISIPIVTTVLIGVLMILSGLDNIALAGSQTFSSAGSGNWIAPYNSTGTVELWGAGGGGGAGGGSNKNGGGGGAGGQYSITILTFHAGTSYAYVVGTAGAAGVSGGANAKNGSSTTFVASGTTYTAAGGAFGLSYASSSTGGVGTSTGGVGTTIYAGGSGATGSASLSGGGGSGAGSTGAGNAASTVTGGAAVSNNGGAGGNGNSSNATAGTAGSNYGGGGGAGTKSSNGAAGAGGLIVITYNNPSPTLTSISPTSTNAGSATTTLTLTGTNFASSSAPDWNGSALATTTITSSSITATIPTSDLTSGGTSSVTVFTPTPGGGTSGSQTFTVNTILPTVTTQAASAVLATTATGNGNLTATGGANADTEGFVYATSTKSLPGNVATSSSGYSFAVTNSGSFGTGAFTASLSSLTGNTTYYGRAYAHNSIGYTYGSEVNFLTLPNIPGTPTYASITTSSVAVSWTAPTGAATYYALDRATSSNGTYTQVTTTTSLTYTNSGLSGGTSYWYEVAGVNASGTGSFSATSTMTTNTLAPDATSVSTTTALGGVSGNSITITGTNFGTVATSSAANCSGGAGTGCVQFIVGGTATVASASITSWSNTSITFTISPTLASYGGVGALEVWAASASDTTPLNFYIYPNITAIQTPSVSNAAREYNASDTDGLVMITGDHFGTSGTSTILGITATQYSSTSTSCTVGGYTSSTVCLEVPASIATATYSGNIVLTRASDGLTSTWSSFGILPRITGVSPNSTSTGDLVQLIGNHFCQTGTCPVSPNRSSTANNVSFGSNKSADSDFQNLTGGGGVCNGSSAAWSDGEICVNVPAAASIGSASTTVTSNNIASNIFPFTVTAPPAPNAPGTPTYSSITTSGMTVGWTAPGGGSSVSYYSLLRATSSNGTYAQVTTTTGLSYADSGLSANTSYWYEVAGVNGGGTGADSVTSTQVTLPGAPGTPSYSNVNTSTLTASWTSPTGGATYYSLARATSSNGTYAQITTTTSLSYNDSSLSPNTSYWYEVRGVNGAGNGAYSATSTITTSNFNNPPSTPTENGPANGLQNVSVTPTFTMTATDTESNNLQYKVTIYSAGGCSSGLVQTDDQSASQTGWSGQNASSSHEYTSGTQGSFTVQTALSQGTTYYWQASAKDPEGSNTWTNSASCNSFSTTNGLWTTDSGGWSISSNKLTVTPGTGNYAQLHVAGQNLTNAVIYFRVSASSGSAGAIGPIFRADSGSNNYQFEALDFGNQETEANKTLSNTETTINSHSTTLSASTLYDVAGNALGSYLEGAYCISTFGYPCGMTGNSGQTDLTGPGFVGIGASGNNTFSITDFAVYSSSIITMSGLPAGYSWSGLDHAGNVIQCETGSQWDTLGNYEYQIPLDYDSGGGQIAVWSNNSCTGSSTLTYPSSGLSQNIFGGDAYSYGTTSGGTVLTDVVASATISVNAAGLISN